MTAPRLQPPTATPRALALLAVLLCGCTTFTGTLPRDASEDDGGGGGFGPGNGGGPGGTIDAGPGGPAPCAQPVCWTQTEAPAASVPGAPACNPAGVISGCPAGWSCTTATANLPAQGDTPPHAAALCTADPVTAASPLVLDTAPRPAAMVNGVEVTLTVTVNGAPLDATAGEPGSLQLVHRDDGATVWLPLPAAGSAILTASLRPGRFDATLRFGDRGPATAPPVPVHGVLEVTAAGDLALDVAAPATTVSLSLDGGDVSEAEPGGSRGELVVAPAGADPAAGARVTLPATGPTLATLALPTGAWRLSWDASASTAPFVPRQHVLLEAAATAGGALTYDLDSVSLFVAPTVDGNPPPDGSVVLFDSGLPPARPVTVKAGTFAATVFASPVDVILQVPAGSAAAPAGSVLLAEDHQPIDQETIAEAVQTVPIAGTITVNGAPMLAQSAGAPARVELRWSPDYAPCSVPISVSEGSFTGKVYPGVADAWYIPSVPPVNERPLQQVRLAQGVDPAAGPHAWNIAVAAVGVQVLAGGQTPPDAGAGASRGQVTLEPAEGEDGLGPLTSALPAAGAASVSFPVSPGTYDVRVSLLPGDPSWPAAAGTALPATEITAAASLIADVSVAPLTVELRPGGAVPAALPTAGARGALRFVSASGDQVDAVLPGVGAASATVPLWGGAWSVYYLCEDPCKAPLAARWPVPLVEGLAVGN